MSPLLSVENVSHHYGTLAVLQNVSLEIGKGSYTVLLGPSGSGKTTLLSILGGFVQPSQGRVLIEGADCTTLSPARRPTATVFQDYALFPHMTVGNNVGFGLRMAGMGRIERMAKALEMLEVVGLAEAIDRKPHQLSGGQRQRVALARALVVEPTVLLLDEPLGALDLKLRRQMQDELKVIQHRVGTAFIHVTHDQEEAMALADHLVVMNLGRIEDQGPPEQVYGKPRTWFSATFMGESMIVAGVVSKTGKIVTGLGQCDAKGLPPGIVVKIALRPEHIHLAGKVRARVTDVVYQGSFRRVTAVTLDEHAITAMVRLSADTVLKVGDVVKLGFDPQHAVVLSD